VGRMPHLHVKKNGWAPTVGKEAHNLKRYRTGVIIAQLPTVAKRGRIVL